MPLFSSSKKKYLMPSSEVQGMHLQRSCTKFEASQGSISSLCLRKAEQNSSNIVSLYRKHNLTMLIGKNLRLPCLIGLDKVKTSPDSCLPSTEIKFTTTNTQFSIAVLVASE